jgi:RNA polymerase sigma-70 factor, ECF subfamily
VNEADLIKKIKAADMIAFNELVSEYRQRVINTCYRFLLTQEDAQDISQEVFIEVYQSISAFRADSKLSTWIYRITVSKCLDEIKKRKRKKRITSLGKILHLDNIVEWMAGSESPDKYLHLDEKMKQVMQALDALPDNQRVAFTLSKIEGYTNNEIADIMNTTTIAVESLVSRAKKKVSGELERIIKS